MTLDALLPTFAGFLLVVMRCAALCAVAPLFGTRSVPARIRLGVALAIAVVAFTAAGGPAFAGWARGSALVSAAVGETAIGLAAGLAARFMLDAAAAAGHAIAVSMGLGFGAVVDPLHGAESTALSELMAILALGIAVGLGLHREAIAWVCRSVIESPPGAPVALRDLAATLVSEAARGAALSVRLAFPVLAAVTCGHLALGLLSRAVPQLNLGNVGFSVAILAGGGALFLVAPGAAELAANAAREAFQPR